jgi:hypothetical protein
MDLLEVIRKQMNALIEGPHSAGLRSVLRHVEAAYRHLSRGQSEQDDSAFTDAIYRTNQAFEGSVKEAYRVLAGKDPESTTPYTIEQYLEQHKIFRNRVLIQFTNYRTQWRNPSTHDYKLDFDEDEAFLAIVSVSAFAKLLVDQIAERLSFVAATRDVEAKAPDKKEHHVTERLVDRIIGLFQDFARRYAQDTSAVPIETEAQLMGALAGFLSSVAPDIRFSTGRVFVGTQRPYNVDMVIEKDADRVLVELKRGQHRSLLEIGARQLEEYIQAAKAETGILFLYASKALDYEVNSIPGQSEILVLRPKT